MARRIRRRPSSSRPRAHRRPPLAVRAVESATPPASDPAPGLAAPPVTEQGLVEVAPAAPAPGPPGPTGEQPPEAGDGDGAGAGNGLGDGFGDGFGPGGGGAEMSRELHARVLGNEAVDVRPREGAPTISHDEATALRTRDSFPRLPESVWPEWRPYVVKLEICVAEDGRVREAVLRSSESPRLRCRGAGRGEDLAIPAAPRRRQARRFLSWRRDQIRAMVKEITMRWSWLSVCVVQVGIVAGVGCSARALDPGVPGEPGSEPVDGSPASSVGSRGLPGPDAGPVTTGILVDAWIAFDSDGGGQNRDIYVIRADGAGRRRLTTNRRWKSSPAFHPTGRGSRSPPIGTAASCRST